MTPKRRAFVAEYLKDFNATQAAIRTGYSPRTARLTGHRLITDDNISAEIEAEIERRMMGEDEVRLRFGRIARFDMSKYIRQYGALLAVDTEELIADGYGDMIRKVYQTKDGPRVEFADPEWALDKIAKVSGMYVDKVEQHGDVTVRFVWESADDTND